MISTIFVQTSYMELREFYFKARLGNPNKTPTDYQTKVFFEEFQNQFLGKEIKVCGEIRNVVEDGIVLSTHFTGYHDEFGGEIKTTKITLFIYFKLVTDDKTHFLKGFNLGDLYEATGKIISFSAYEGDLNYTIKTFNISMELLPSKIEKIDSLWINPEYFDLSAEATNIDFNATKPSGCIMLFTMFTVLTLITLRYFI